MTTIAVIDYGASNLGSVVRALKKIATRKHNIIVGKTKQSVEKADKVIFPGQGAMRQCIASLQKSGMDMALLQAIEQKPFFGICLGLQSLFTSSDEDGGVLGLSVFSGQVIHFSAIDNIQDNRYKIPHMGWNQVKQIRPHPLWQGIEDMTSFYFVHSYFVVPEDKTLITGQTDYINHFTSAISKNNLFATQFHPEKSHLAGLKLLSNFLSWEI